MNTARAPVWLPWAAVLLVAITLIGAALAPMLAVHHPLWLIALNPWPRHLILVAPQLEVVPFVTLASMRGLVACTLAYELGLHYGARGAAALAGQSASNGRLLRNLERLFAQWSVPVLIVVPGLASSALAGMSGVPRARSHLLSLLGLLAWACINHRLGAFLAPWTAPLLSFVRENMWLATGVCVVLVVVYQLAVRRRGR